MLSSDFLFPRFFVVPLANPSNFSHCKCFSSQIIIHNADTNILFVRNFSLCKELSGIHMHM